jgi:hypothetical protein
VSHTELKFTKEKNVRLKKKLQHKSGLNLIFSTKNGCKKFCLLIILGLQPSVSYIYLYKDNRF